MRVWIRRGKKHVLPLDIHMDDAIPSALVGRWIVGPIAAIAEGVRHRVEDMPQKSFRKDEAVCASVNNDRGLDGLYTVAYGTMRSHPRNLRSRQTRNRSCA